MEEQQRKTWKHIRGRCSHEPLLLFLSHFSHSGAFVSFSQPTPFCFEPVLVPKNYHTLIFIFTSETTTTTTSYSIHLREIVDHPNEQRCKKYARSDMGPASVMGRVFVGQSLYNSLVGCCDCGRSPQQHGR